MLFLYLLFTFVLSCFNAFSVGAYWTEKKNMPGDLKLTIWAGAVMAWLGFFVVYLIVVVLGMENAGLFIILAQKLGWKMTPEESDALVEIIFNLSYVLTTPAWLGSGAIIWFHSVKTFRRRRDLTSGGVAGYNTFAQAHNMYSAAKHLPGAVESVFDGIGELFEDEDNGKAIIGLMLILLPMVISAGGAYFTLWVIITASDAKFDLAAEPAPEY
jgi:hypothetical protein